MERYEITLEGVSSLIMHKDNPSWSERVKAWSKDPSNRGESAPGDDRTPGWSWLGSLYHDGKVIALDSDNIMTMLREAGASVIVSGKKTFKSQSQSGITPMSASWTLEIPRGPVDNPVWKTIDVEEILSLKSESDFAMHQLAAEEAGFELFIKRARVTSSKHIRVRPIFHQWRVKGDVLVTDKMITQSILMEILTIGGLQKGLCDWRPSSRTPGSFGRFTPSIKRLALNKD
jgi:hypothetical protein